MLERIDGPGTRSQWDEYPPGGTDVFYDDGKVPEPGSILAQKSLGLILRKLVEAESAAPGHRADGVRAARDCFYTGEIAQIIHECAHRVGGILGLKSLASYEAKYETPLKTSYLGHEVHGQSVWTQGAVLMQSLNILENFDLRGMGHNSTAYIHTVSQAVNLAFADREAYYGDPDFVDVPVDGLLSKEYAKERAALIDPNKAMPELPPPGDPYKYSKMSSAAARPSQPAASIAAADGGGADSGTTHISAIDRDGNMVCATPSGGSFGKSVYFPELGCALSTRIEMFNFEDGHPNRLEPFKRPRTTLVNYMVTKDGVPIMTVGCPGGDHQAQANMQLVLNSLLWGMNPQEAVEAPRFASQGVRNSFYPHTYYPAQLGVEPGIAPDVMNELRDMGHEVVSVASAGMGATVNVRNPETGTLASSADPRRACYALSW